MKEIEMIKYNLKNILRNIDDKTLLFETKPVKLLSFESHVNFVLHYL